MSWTTRDHTADVYLVAEGGSVAEAIAESARGLLELVWDGAPPAAERWHDVEVAGEDDADLLAELLTELLVELDSAAEWVVAARVVSLSPGRLAARLGTVPRDGERQPAGREVKAVSRRDLSIEEIDGRYRATALLDL